MRILKTVLIVALLSLPLARPASAQSPGADATSDARLEGFNVNVQVNGSAAGAWGLLIVLAVVALWPLFKDAKRTHLD